MTDSAADPVLTVCMGSACHKLGIYRVLPKLQALIAENNLQERVVLKGAFCLGDCSEGIIVKLNDQTFMHINEDNIADVFRDEMLPVLGQ